MNDPSLQFCDESTHLAHFGELWRTSHAIGGSDYFSINSRGCTFSPSATESRKHTQTATLGSPSSICNHYPDSFLSADRARQPPIIENSLRRKIRHKWSPPTSAKRFTSHKLLAAVGSASFATPQGLFPQGIGVAPGALMAVPSRPNRRHPRHLYPSRPPYTTSASISPGLSLV